jgi:hypothetical protein
VFTGPFSRQDRPRAHALYYRDATSDATARAISWVYKSWGGIYVAVLDPETLKPFLIDPNDRDITASLDRPGSRAVPS